jgi:hypothetical protein
VSAANIYIIRCEEEFYSLYEDKLWIGTWRDKEDCFGVAAKLFSGNSEDLTIIDEEAIKQSREEYTRGQYTTLTDFIKELQ